MEIARLTAICRKSDCGPLENELVRLRAQIATLEERKTGDSESKAEEEMEFASQADADGELARANADLEERLEIEIDSCFDLQSKNDDLEIEILEIKSELACRKCEVGVEHEEHYKWLPGKYDQELDENMQQGQQIAERGRNQKTEGSDGDDGDGGPCGGNRWESDAEERAYQQATKKHSS
jgi:hypothetical protein